MCRARTARTWAVRTRGKEVAAELSDDRRRLVDLAGRARCGGVLGEGGRRRAHQEQHHHREEPQPHASDSHRKEVEQTLGHARRCRLDLPEHGGHVDSAVRRRVRAEAPRCLLQLARRAGRIATRRVMPRDRDVDEPGTSDSPSLRAARRGRPARRARPAGVVPLAHGPQLRRGRVPGQQGRARPLRLPAALHGAALHGGVQRRTASSRHAGARRPCAAARHGAPRRRTERAGSQLPRQPEPCGSAARRTRSRPGAERARDPRLRGRNGDRPRAVPGVSAAQKTGSSPSHSSARLT